ncbi:hypothetical protein [Campylobacter insulaenigrae]|uniref:hypothetical protein n=1 Tax=Campylobacter insulaenigrae TaxID=260714 RepID=UPI002152C9FC|nr:hypothetical protein [Campylobacter insulaenigrae]MCR6594055.1 hypothetical protein [Campylobacter insulaenigrae]
MILKPKILLSLLLGLNPIFLMGIFVYKGYNIQSFISFEFGFCAQNFIILTSFINYKNFILKNTKNYYFIERPLQIFTKKINSFPEIVKFILLEDDFKPKVKNIFKNAIVFFSIFKIFTYIFLVLGFLVLEFQGLMDIFALFVAMFVTPLAVLIYNFLIRKC